MNYSAKDKQGSIPAHQIDQFQKLIFDLYQCCQARMQRQSERFSLPDAELRCLRLFGNERYLTPKGIAHQMGVVKSRITKLIDGLVRKELVHRFKDPADSRITLLRLTAKGQKKLGQINAHLRTVNTAVLSRMSPTQRENLLVHLDQLRVSMKAVAGRRPGNSR